MASVKDLTPFGIRLESCRRIPDEDFDKLVRQGCQPIKGDVLIAKDGATALDTVCEVKTDESVVLLSSVAILRPNPAIIHSSFLRHYLDSPLTRSYLKTSFISGAAIPRVVLKDLKRARVSFPPLSLQRRIAGILSAYDELIENSQRRIKILETMARALYREWFVHFRFPGYENVPRVASPLGEIPQGWKVKSIAEVCESVSYGYTASASREEVGPRFLRITDIVPEVIDWAGVPFCKIPEDKAQKYLLKHGDIVVARTGATTGYAKRLNKLHPATVFASYLVRVRAKDGVSNRMLGIVMESDEYKQYIQTNIGGAAQPQANAVVLASMQLVVAPSSVGDKFDRVVAPMIDEQEFLAVKIQNLRRIRDLLLPRLLSGQVSLQIDEAEQQLVQAQAESVQSAPVPASTSTSPAVINADKSAHESALLKVADAAPSAYVNHKPPDIEDTDRSEVLCALRALFSDGVARDRATAIREVAHALGYQRTGSHIQEVLSTDLLTALRRGILVKEGGAYSLGFRSLAECTRESIKKDFESAIGRGWINRDDAVRAFARWLGFARVGKVIDDTVRSLINGVIREDRLETDGPELIRRR